MKTKNFISLIFLIAFGFTSRGQQNVKEQVYLHINSTELISGETLFFSAYCLSERTHKPSPLSQVLYVELIGEKGPAYQGKILLENGLGQGDIFVSSVITSGKYQLIAYTRWMRNFGDYFQMPITIINPFEEYDAEDTEEKEIEMTFTPSNGGIVTGLPNTVGFRISGGPKGLKWNGKITNDKGDVITEFDSDFLGNGVFTYTPKATDSYKAIVQSGGSNLLFFEVPKGKKEGVTLNFTTSKNTVKVQVASTSKEVEFGSLEVTSATKAAMKKEINFNSENYLILADLSDGLNMVEVRDESGNVIASAPYIKAIDQPKMGTLAGDFSTRSPNTIKQSLDPGNYSVSIRKQPEYIENLRTYAVQSDIQSKMGSDENLMVYTKKGVQPNPQILSFTTQGSKSNYQVDSIQFLPEYREQLLTGRVISRTDMNLDKKLVSLAFPGEIFNFRFTQTNADGYFTIPYGYVASTNSDGYLLAMDFDEDLSIEEVSPFIGNKLDLDFKMVPLDSNQIKEIIDRSIRSQIQNIYFVSDSIKPSSKQWENQINFDFKYVLDEYERFTTLQETFTEYIIATSLRDKRTPIFKMYQEDQSSESEPLILLDGVPVAPSKIYDHSPFKIESISLLTNKYFCGPMIGNGVLSFKSKESLLNGFSLDSYYTKVSLAGFAPVKKYLFPNYELAKNSRRPDQRDQLYWDPKLSVASKEDVAITFSTSDLSGSFELIIEGYKTTGEAVSIVKTFEVIPPKSSSK